MRDDSMIFKSFDEALEIGDTLLIPDSDEERERFCEFLESRGYRFNVHLESCELWLGPNYSAVCLACL